MKTTITKKEKAIEIMKKMDIYKPYMISPGIVYILYNNTAIFVKYYFIYKDTPKYD